MAVVDNSLGKGQARISTLEGLPKLDTKSLEKQLRNALEEEFKAGKITKEVYEASK
jgi:predicted transcriptional regulator